MHISLWRGYGATVIPVALLLVTSVLMVAAGALYAGDPAGSVAPQTAYRAILDSAFSGGATSGYGKSQLLAVTSSPATTSVTTGVDPNGVYKIDFGNAGSNTIFISLNGSAVSTANCQVVLPAGWAYTSVTKSPVSTVKYYCPSGTSSLVEKH